MIVKQHHHSTAVPYVGHGDALLKGNYAMADETPSNNLGKPSMFAIAVQHAGGNIHAGALLFRLKSLFDPKKPIGKLHRFDKEWNAMSRADWAASSGLTFSQLRHIALPILRELPFITVKAMRTRPDSPVLLWIALDLQKLTEAPVDGLMQAEFKKTHLTVTHALNPIGALPPEPAPLPPGPPKVYPKSIEEILAPPTKH